MFGWLLRHGWTDGPWGPRPWGWGRPLWWDVLAWLLPVLFVALLGLLIGLVLVRLTRKPAEAGPPAPDRALEEARVRYARGEIDRETFLRIAGDLGGRPAEGGGTGG